MSKILFVFTSASAFASGEKTGWYLPEAAHPYYILSPHYTIDFASPKGGSPPLDQASVTAFVEERQDADSIKFLNDETIKDKLANTKKLSDVNSKDYAAIFYVGGHGPALDLPFDDDNHKLISEVYQAGNIVSAVCHGSAALVGGVDAAGKSIFAGKAFTGLSNVEEDISGKTADMPFLLEDKIISLGGKFEKADEPFGAKVIVDGQLITGQNPASASGVGQEILKALKK